ncbi:MAG: SDR family NAD(P)-dependent oxidoreductase [Hyphomicrobiales bacterium]|nr:SDR family NAD(P)-dependent oxidoreductase [Hyphomicrobiales bacterium]
MGKAALVTGGSRGIGRAIAERLRSEGYDVLTCGRGERPKDLPAAITWAQADVSDSEQTDALAQKALGEYGGVALLVNNAGVQVEKTVAQSSNEDWEKVIGTNCRGVFNMCRALLPSMEKNGGVIINIGSISGELSDGNMALYNASKAFVHALTRSIALDHGPNVRCNAILPGWIETEMAADAFALAEDPEAAKTDALKRHPARRFGKPEDIANAVVWLASEQAGFATGQCFRIDGGLTSASPLQPMLFS